MSFKDTKVIVLKENIWNSWARDFGTFLTFTGLISIGVFLESSVLQWVGAIIGFFAIACRSIAFFNKQKVTVAQARKILDELEAREGAA